MSKLNEYFIIWKSGYKNQATVWKEKPKLYNDSLAHVIEYEAYQQSLEIIKKLITDLEDIERGRYWKTRSELVEIDTETAINITRQALPDAEVTNEN